MIWECRLNLAPDGKNGIHIAQDQGLALALRPVDPFLRRAHALDRSLNKGDQVDTRALCRHALPRDLCAHQAKAAVAAASAEEEPTKPDVL